jgi:hypothetical protein
LRSAVTRGEMAVRAFPLGVAECRFAQRGWNRAALFRARSTICSRASR